MKKRLSLLISLLSIISITPFNRDLTLLSQLFELPQNSYTNPVLICATEGLGAKATVAQRLNRPDVIGKDLVTSCINNLVAQGATPLFFIDHTIAPVNQIDHATQRIAGIAAICKRIGCTVLNSQTTIMPEIFQKDCSSSIGFAVGIAEKNQVLNKATSLTDGDLIIGLACNGLHLDGFETVLSFLNDLHMDLTTQTPFASSHEIVGNALIEPATIYAPAIVPLIRKNMVKAIAHVNHGGIAGSIGALLPIHLQARLDLQKWYIPPIFRWIKQITKQTEQYIAHNFSLGIGMALIVDREQADAVLKELAMLDTRGSIIGSLSKRIYSADPCTIEGSIGSSRIRVMVIGGSGREHALAWKLSQSPFVELVFVAPGNSGSLNEKKIQNIRINPSHHNALITYARQNNIDLVIVGPAAPLAGGIVDEFIKQGIRCFGPTKKAAQIETSKNYAKEFMRIHNIPTPAYAICKTSEEIIAAIEASALPVVIKADCLDAEKGVTIAQTKEEALNTAKEILALYGTVLIEQFVEGQPISFAVISDGTTIVPLSSCQQYQHRYSGNTGPLTEGMGSCCPAPIVDKKLHNQIMTTIIEPAIKGLRAQGDLFAGFLYAGMVITPHGEPIVLEFNCHLGECEAQALLMRLQTDLFILCNAAYNKQLDLIKLKWDERPSVNVVLAHEPIATRSEKKEIIVGISPREKEGEKLFHLQTTLHDGKIVPNGSRILAATALGQSFEGARNNAYSLARQIYWPSMQYRQDIGYDLID